MAKKEFEFTENLMRLIAAELRLLNGMTAAREMFGKPYFALGIGEKTIVDQTVLGMVAANFHTLSPETFADQTARNPVGFVTPASGTAQS
jgi:hypothetical protein